MSVMDVIFIGLLSIIALMFFAVIVLTSEVRHSERLEKVWVRQLLDYAKELDQLRDETGKAKDDFRRAYDTACRQDEMLREYIDENAKLRKLVRVYRACHDHINACRGCSELPDCDALQKMRTLGSEVGIECYID